MYIAAKQQPAVDLRALPASANGGAQSGSLVVHTATTAGRARDLLATHKIREPRTVSNDRVGSRELHCGVVTTQDRLLNAADLLQQEMEEIMPGAEDSPKQSSIPARP
jgi:hypothetical protein